MHRGVEQPYQRVGGRSDLKSGVGRDPRALPVAVVVLCCGVTLLSPVICIPGDGSNDSSNSTTLESNGKQTSEWRRHLPPLHHPSSVSEVDERKVVMLSVSHPLSATLSPTLSLSHSRSLTHSLSFSSTLSHSLAHTLSLTHRLSYTHSLSPPHILYTLSHSSFSHTLSLPHILSAIPPSMYGEDIDDFDTF
eukprot:Sspe_Gene.109321::Locus_89261_Transcript_3_3_Confidence_0.750_Length_756::g.109321::m.109321